jgi:hypothetical protein
MYRFGRLGFHPMVGGMHQPAQAVQHQDWYPPDDQRDPRTDASLAQMRMVMRATRRMSDERRAYDPDLDFDDRAWPWDRRQVIANRMHTNGVECFLEVQWSSTLHEQTYAAVVTGQEWRTRHSPETALLMITATPVQGIADNEFTTITPINIWSPWHVSIFKNSDPEWSYADLRHILHTFDRRVMRLFFEHPYMLGRELTYGVLDANRDPIAQDQVVRRCHRNGYYGDRPLHISL